MGPTLVPLDAAIHDTKCCNRRRGHLLAGIDLAQLGFEVTEQAASAEALHVILTKRR